MRVKMASPRDTCVCMCVLVCERVCARMCELVRACVCMSVISENKNYFLSLHYLINHTLLIYPSDFFNLCHVGLFFYFYMRR